MLNRSSREELIRELEEDGDSFFEEGRSNNIFDLSLTIVIVLASLVATVLATTDPKNVSRLIVASVAAIPAAAASLQRIIGIRERSNWYFLYAANVRSLATKLKYADAPNVEEYASKRAELEVEMEREWLKIGHSGAAPSGRSTGRVGGGRRKHGP
jgi:pimeloyl-ACP methyl ester carboxylesterase